MCKFAIALACSSCACHGLNAYTTEEPVPGVQPLTVTQKLQSKDQAGTHNDMHRLAMMLQSFSGASSGGQTRGISPRPLNKARPRRTAIQMSKDDRSSAETPRRTAVQMYNDDPSSAETLSESTFSGSKVSVQQVLLQEFLPNGVSFKSVIVALQAYVENVVTLKAALSAVIAGTANLLAQASGNGWQVDNLDQVQLLSYMMFTVFYSNGFQPNIYRFIEKISGGDNFKKILIDAGVYAPLIYLPAFYFITGTVQGLSLPECAARLVDLWFNSIIAYWEIWPLLMFAYFRWVPEEWRVLYLQICGLLEKSVYTLIGMSK